MYEQAIASEKVDSLILIPVFICDFLCIHPFNDGNVTLRHQQKATNSGKLLCR